MKRGRDYGLTEKEFNKWKQLESEYRTIFYEWKGGINSRREVQKACMRAEKFEYEHGLTGETCPDEY